MSVEHKPRKKLTALAPGAVGSGRPEPRTKHLSAEEISSSLLVEDTAEETMPSSAEELSGSLLLEDPTAERDATGAASDVELPTLQRPVPAPLLEHPAPGAAVLPTPARAAATAPTPAGASDAAPQPAGTPIAKLPTPTVPPDARSDVEVNQLPYGPFGRLRSSLIEHAPKGRRARVVAWSLLAAVGLLGAWLLASKSHGEAGKVSALPAFEAATTASASAVAAPLSPLAGATSVTTTGCTAVGTSHVIAPNAVLAAGVEARAFGDDVLLGFAPSVEQAIVVRVAPASLSAVETTTVRVSGAVRRVTPLLTKTSGLTAAVDVDRNDRTQGRRTVATDPPLQVGSSNGHLAWWKAGGRSRGSKGTLWALDGDAGEAEALRGALWPRMPEAPDVMVLAFRRSGAVWLGAAEDANGWKPKRELLRVPGMGPTVGSPAIAINRGTALAAWADRATAEDPWSLRWVRFGADEAPGDPNTFKPPAGGRGEQAMSPALSALPSGGFLLVWTEGLAAAHDVRALTLSAEGEPIGAPLAISSEGSNAGQGQAAVGAGGRGLVAFLESEANGFRVVARPILCAP